MRRRLTVIGSSASASRLITRAAAHLPSSLSAFTGVPLGVAYLDNELSGATDIVLAYRNFGTVDLWGSDIGVDVGITDKLFVAGSYSYANKDYFRDVGGDQDIALNAPAGQGSVSARQAASSEKLFLRGDSVILVLRCIWKADSPLCCV